MRAKASGRFKIDAGAIGSAVAVVKNHFALERAGGAIVAIQEEGAFVGMTVATQNKVGSVLLKNGKGVKAHLDLVGLQVGVVRAVAIRGMMPKGDNPILRRSSQISAQPSEHRSSGQAILAKGVEADEVRV